MFFSIYYEDCDEEAYNYIYHKIYLTRFFVFNNLRILIYNLGSKESILFQYFNKNLVNLQSNKKQQYKNSINKKHKYLTSEKI